MKYTTPKKVADLKHPVTHSQSLPHRFANPPDIQ